MLTKTHDTSVLYIRLRRRIEEELVIKNLHPLIQNVRLMRQKSANSCLVRFDSPEECKQVRDALKKKTFEGKKIVVKYGFKKEKEDYSNCITLVAKDLPTKLKRRHFKKAIPEMMTMRIRKVGGNVKGAILIFDDEKVVNEILSKDSIRVSDVDVKFEKAEL